MFILERKKDLKKNLNFHFRKPKKEEQVMHKVSRRKKIKLEWKTMKQKIEKQQRKLIKPKVGSLKSSTKLINLNQNEKEKKKERTKNKRQNYLKKKGPSLRP